MDSNQYLTATEADAAGFLTAYPCGTPLPTSSNLNYAVGQTVPNFVMIDLVGHPQNGKICIFSSARTHVIADVTGYVLNAQEPFTPGGRYNALTQPRRLLDSRTEVALAAGETRRVPVLGVGGVPASGVSGAVLNATVNFYIPSLIFLAFP